MKAVANLLKIVKERLPTIEELLAVCDELGIGFRLTDAGPVMRAGGDNEAVAELLAKLFGREPFRSAVIRLKLSDQPPVPPAPPPRDETVPPALQPDVPAGAVIVVMDAKGNMDGNRRGEPFMWTWVGAERWYYVAVNPIPVKLAAKEKQ